MSSSSINPVPPVAIDSQAVRHCLEAAPQPLSAAAVAKLLGKKSGVAIQPALDADVRDGRIFQWPEKKYWTQNPRALARERLLRITANEILTAGPLRKRVANETPKISGKIISNVRAELARENLLRAVRSGKSTWIVNVQNPEPYLEIRIHRLLAEFGLERTTVQIRALLSESQHPDNVEQIGRAPEVHEIAETMLAAINRIALAPGTTVTFYRLRQQPELAGVPKEIFDRAAFLLQGERKALLAVHDHAPRLPETERNELVTDGLGRYYVSIYTI